jgi:hypothetical protein
VLMVFPYATGSPYHSASAQLCTSVALLAAVNSALESGILSRIFKVLAGSKSSMAKRSIMKKHERLVVSRKHITKSIADREGDDDAADLVTRTVVL